MLCTLRGKIFRACGAQTRSADPMATSLHRLVLSRCSRCSKGVRGGHALRPWHRRRGWALLLLVVTTSCGDRVGDGQTAGESFDPCRSVFSPNADLAASVRGGRASACVREGASVQCWALWPSETGDACCPAPTVTGVTDFDVGRQACAVIDGKVLCWGPTTLGLGLDRERRVQVGANYGDDEPVSIADATPLGEEATAVTVGGTGVCVSTRDARGLCWGRHPGMAHPEDGREATKADPVEINAGAPLVRVAMSDNNVCAVDESGALRCWGRLCLFGEQDFGPPFGVEAERVPLDVGGAAVDVQLSDTGICARRTDGTWLCWGELPPPGENERACLSDGQQPVDVGWVIEASGGGRSRPILSGYPSVCLLEEGEVRCSTAEGWERLPFAEPVVAFEGSPTAGYALGPDGTLTSWGGNLFGDLGYGLAPDSDLMVSIVDQPALEPRVCGASR